MKRLVCMIGCLLYLFGTGVQLPVHAQQPQPASETQVSRMKYTGTFEKARRLAYQEKKLIFVNCYADWAGPCKGMEKLVFSDAEFCAYMDKNFINLFVDMQTPAGKEFGKEYNVKSFATYLFLNYKGEVVHRLSGGAQLPEFKERVQLALSNKTSLAGSRQKYESGKYSKKDLYNYLKALKLADEDSTFRHLGKEYMAMLQPKEYPEQRNWMFASLHKDRQGEYYQYLIANKAEFVKNNGEKQVNNYIESLLCSDLLPYATGDADYDIMRLGVFNQEIKAAALPDTCPSNILLNIAQLRGERNMHSLLKFMETRGHYLDAYYNIRSNIELTFNWPGISDNERKELIAYLQRAVKRERSTAARRLTAFIRQLEVGNKGIEFAYIPFEAALLRAGAEKKLVFVDCYTSWCGPCRSMASTVFLQKELGDYFNTHFINLKIDMEKGEGVELAKRFGVTAYPTLLFIDNEGQVIEKAVGYKNAIALLKLAQNVTK